MSQGGGVHFLGKIWWENVWTFKRQSTATEPEIKQVMSAQLKTLLTVHGGGQTIIEKWLNDWLGNRCSTLNSQ